MQHRRTLAARTKLSPAGRITLGYLALTGCVVLVGGMLSPPGGGVLLRPAPVLGEILSLAAGLILMHRFISRRFDRAEEERELLVAQGNRLRSFFEAAGVGLAVVDASSGRFLDFNGAFCEIAGYSGSELLELTFPELADEHLSQDGERVRRLLNGELRELTTQKHYCRRSGKMVRVRLTLSPLPVGAGKPRERLVLIRDITAELDQANRALVEEIAGRGVAEADQRASEDRFRLIDRAPIAIGIFRGTSILSANRRFLEMFGFRTIEEVRRSSLGELFAPHCREEVVQRAKQRALGLPVPTEYETVAQRREGGAFPVHVAATPVHLTDGRATIAFFYDISERKKAQEAERRYTRRLIELEEGLRRRLAAELHDDIGQELTALGLNLSYLGTALGGVEGELRSRLEDSRAIARGISKWVRDMMTELRPSQLDELGLAAALEYHAALFRSRTGIAVAVHAAGNLPPLSLETETALFRIVQEALTNVAKHAAASRVSISLAPHGERVRLTVADNGRGFSPAEGSGGWGLTVMRERCASVGGLFDVRSFPGRGATVIAEVGEEG